jgi:3-oxoadipate enol-lactonase
MPFVHATDGTRIHYEVTGKSGATPVLMIQGLGASKNAWNLQRIAMATRFRIISFDNRGAGRSGKPTEPFTLEQMADDAIAVLDAAGIASALQAEQNLGYMVSSGRYWEHTDEFDKTKLSAIDSLWLQVMREPISAEPLTQL